MIAAELAAIASGWSEEELLDLAGATLGRAIGRFFTVPGIAIGYLGKGHNAADAVVALKVLRDEFSWRIALRPAYPESDWAPLLTRKWKQHGMADESADDESLIWPTVGPLLILDGLVGTGARGTLRGPLAEHAREIDHLRRQHGAIVAAVDLPSGIDADTGEVTDPFVTADLTFMIANAKSGLLFGHAAHAVGALALVPIDALHMRGSGSCDLISPQSISIGKAPRPFDLHKGNTGRVAILAGSKTYTGAAVLAALGALRGGAGRVMLHVPEDARHEIASRCPPEIIIRSYTSSKEWLATNADAIVVGCGLGTMNSDTSADLIELIRNTPVPMVVDADALNAIATSGARDILNECHVLTPHPGEFRRLAPELADLPREAAATAFRECCPSTLLLKGCRSIVAARGQPLWCNATGNPGMASDGHGDLLAGVIGALMASGIELWASAALAAWLCGRASEIAVWNGQCSQESLTPSDAAHALGQAFRDWHRALR
jgi:NAD(P)H-hydrate epimerase